MMKSKRQRPAFMAAALMLAMGLAVQAAPLRERYEEKFEKTVPLSSDGKVSLANISGEIRVETWPQNQVRIEALKISEARTEERAKENAGLVMIEVKEGAGLVAVETHYPETRGWFRRSEGNVSVHYKLWIPERASLKVHAVSGNVDVLGIGGYGDIDVVSGNIMVSRPRAGVQGKAVSGVVEVEDASGDLDLATVSGRIYVRGARGSVEAKTTSGGIELIDVSEARNVRAKALSGNISFRGKVSPGGRYSLEVHSGSISLILPADAGFELEAETFSGGVESEFPIQVIGKISRKELRGTVGGGGASVRLKAFSGNIRLRKD